MELLSSYTHIRENFEEKKIDKQALYTMIGHSVLTVTICSNDFSQKRYIDNTKTNPVSHYLQSTKSVWWCLCLQSPCPLPVFSYFAVSGTFVGVTLWAVVWSPQPMTACRVWGWDKVGTRCQIMSTHPRGAIEPERRGQLWMLCLQTAKDKSCSFCLKQVKCYTLYLNYWIPQAVFILRYS